LKLYYIPIWIPMVVNTAFTAYVDSTFGIADPQLQNANAPFLTIIMAISAILNSTSPPSLFQQWNIDVAPGTYFENPTHPGFTNLIGYGTATSLVWTLTVTGAGIVRDILINTNNVPGVIINRPVNIGDAAFVNVVVFTTFSGTFTGPVTAVEVIIGDCTFESGAIFTSFSGSGPRCSAVHSTGGLALFNVLTFFSTSGSFDRANVFDFSGDKTTITECVINADFSGGNRGVIFSGSNITAAAKENRITVTSASTSEVDIVFAGDAGIILLTSNYIDISGVPTAAQVLARAKTGVTTLPQVRFITNEFVQSEIPLSVGTFGQLSFDLFDEEGTFKFSGGLYGPMKRVCGLYTVKRDDFTVMVSESCGFAKITLSSGAKKNGQLIYVKNLSGNNVDIVGDIFDGSLTLHAGKSVNLQSDDSKYYLLATF